MRSALRIGLWVGLALVVAAPGAQAKKSKRYGIEGKFLSYDQDRQVFTVLVLSRRAGGFGGGSIVGGPAPKDVEPKAEMELAVKPEGSVLSRTVIKSSEGTGLDKTGTQEGFSQAVSAIPTDRALAFSIEPNPAAKSNPDAPRYRLLTLIIKLTEAEIQQRFREFLEAVDDEVDAP
jgi:hypothetical protein